jgi:hypothetical protein
MVDRKLTELPLKRAEVSEKNIIQPVAIDGKKKGVFLTEESRMNGSLGFREQKIKGACDFKKQIDRGSSIFNTNNLTLGLNYKPNIESVKKNHVPSVRFDRVAGREPRVQQMRGLMEFKRYEYGRDSRYEGQTGLGGVQFEKMLPRGWAGGREGQQGAAVSRAIDARTGWAPIIGISGGRPSICLMWRPSCGRPSGGLNR